MSGQRLTQQRYETLITGLCLFEVEIVDNAEADNPAEGRRLRRELESATKWLNAMRHGGS